MAELKYPDGQFRRGRIVRANAIQFEIRKDRLRVVMTVARLFLGLAMMPYAIDKLFDLQFKVPAWSYAQPLGSTSGSTLVWAMFGYSATLQVLLGIFELVPALLLLNVRTRRVGAVLMFPVLLNIVLINFSLDLWHGPKVVGSTLLAVDIFLILYDHKLYLG